MSQQNHSFIRQINAMLQALGSDEGQADPAPRLTFQQYMKYGPMSENVEGPIQQMMQRAGDAATADLAQQWNPDKTRAAIIPNNFRQYPRGRPR
jgi:uncharacterized membrane protein YccC